MKYELSFNYMFDLDMFTAVGIGQQYYSIHTRAEWAGSRRIRIVRRYI